MSYRVAVGTPPSTALGYRSGRSAAPLPGR